MIFTWVRIIISWRFSIFIVDFFMISQGPAPTIEFYPVLLGHCCFSWIFGDWECSILPLFYLSHARAQCTVHRERLYLYPFVSFQPWGHRFILWGALSTVLLFISTADIHFCFLRWWSWVLLSFCSVFLGNLLSVWVLAEWGWPAP